MKKPAKEKKKRRSVLRFLRWGTLIPVLCLFTAGIALFCVPAEGTRGLSIAAGVVLSLAAFALIAGSFFGSANVLQIVCGAGFVALAVWLFVQPGEAENALYFVLTGVVLVRALVGLFYALFAKRKESRLWQISMAGSIFLLVAAIVYFFLPMLELGGQTVLLGALCCLDALFETAALLHRLTNAVKEKKQEEPKEETSRKKKKDGAEETETTEETQEGGSRRARRRGKEKD